MAVIAASPLRGDTELSMPHVAPDHELLSRQLSLEYSGSRASMRSKDTPALPQLMEYTMESIVIESLDVSRRVSPLLFNEGSEMRHRRTE
jgi:hypothetical protein